MPQCGPHLDKHRVRKETHDDMTVVCESWELNHSPLSSMQQMPITMGSHSDQEKWKFEVSLKGDKLVMPISLCMARKRAHSTTKWINNRYYPETGCEVHLKMHSPLHSLTCHLPWDAVKTKQFWVSLRVCQLLWQVVCNVLHVPRWCLHQFSLFARKFPCSVCTVKGCNSYHY